MERKQHTSREKRKKSECLAVYMSHKEEKENDSGGVTRVSLLFLFAVLHLFLSIWIREGKLVD